MRLKLASRQSDLARWQAVRVGHAFEALHEHPHIEYMFKASLGDQNLDLPLAGMGAKGVFTEDFYQDLVGGACDLVVHSWKDLPVEERKDTRIAMTLPRADTRDILLVPEEVWAHARTVGRLTVLTSSPRRVYNLSTTLKNLLPARVSVEFQNVRGNVPTRLGKMKEQGAALILAKAGLDRLLQGEREGFFQTDLGLQKLVSECRFMILPTSLNPGAPAQGALAVEIARANESLNEICLKLNDRGTFTAVGEERRILASYGGGCHQKIGVTILYRPFGKVTSLRGLTDQGEVLKQWSIENSTPWSCALSPEQIFPLTAQQNSWFNREGLSEFPDLHRAAALFVARADALPTGFHPAPRQLVWTAGLQTWQRLARQGVWVHGSSDGLGENEPTGVETLLGPVSWVKLTHADSAAAPGGPMESVATYRLVPKTHGLPDLHGKTHFFWMSTSSFERARQLFPNEIRNGYNACGPGSTYGFLQRQTDLKNPVKVFAGLDQFLTETRPGARP